MRIKTRESQGLVIIELLGSKITRDAGVEELKNVVSEKLQKGHKRLLINLANVTTFDNTGTGVLCACYALVKKKSGRFGILSPRDNVCEWFRITRLISVFEIFHDEEEAFRSFRDQGAGAD